MTVSKYSIGVHGHQFQTDAPDNEYSAGDLTTYLAALGLGPTAAGGAIAHTKLNDQNGLWTTGAIPSVPAHTTLFLAEAKAAGFTTMLAWQTPPAGPSDDAPWTDAGQALLDEFDDAADLAAAIPNVDILLWENEREASGISNSDADEEHRLRFFALEVRAGAIFRAAGKLWACGADQVTMNFLGALDERIAAWDAAEVDYPDWLALHTYGQGGTVPNHLPLIRDAIEYRTGRTWNIVVSEWAGAFEALNAYGTKPQVRDYRAQAFNEHFARSLRRERMHGCYFTLKELLHDHEDYPGQLPLQGIIDGLSDTETSSLPPSADPGGAATRTYRYLIEGRFANRKFNALVRGAAEYARNIVGYPAFWG